MPHISAGVSGLLPLDAETFCLPIQDPARGSSISCRTIVACKKPAESSATRNTRECNGAKRTCKSHVRRSSSDFVDGCVFRANGFGSMADVYFASSGFGALRPT